MRSEPQSTGRPPRSSGGGGGQRRSRGPRSGGPSRRAPRDGDSRANRPASASRTPSETTSRTTPKTPKKLGFFERVIAFFKGEPEGPGKAYGRVITETPDQAASTGATHNRSRQAERPERSSAAPAARAHAETNGDAVEAPKPKTFRKPELVEVTSPKLYVGNLSFDAVESDLAELFAGAGSVQNSEIICHRETQKSKGFAFVTMTTVEEANRAVTELHDKEFMGRRLVVSGAKTPDVR